MLRSAAYSIEQLCRELDRVRMSLPDATMDLPLNESTDLSVRARNVCRNAGATTLRGLCSITESQLLGVRHCGGTTIAEIKQELEKHGLSLR